VPVAWLLLLPVPFLVFWWTHLLKISRAHGAMVAHGVLHDTTAPWVWAALAVVYLVWIVALTVCTIWVFDHLGYHYEPYDRQPRPTRREMRRLRRRQRAGTNLLRAREEAHRAALREISRESRRVVKESDKTDDAGGAADGGDKGEQTSAADGGGDERR
jgi:hypothetical protein